MLKSCFGCCPLRYGVSSIAFVNLILNIVEILIHSLHRHDQYNRFNMVTKVRSTVAPDGNITTEDDYEADFASDIIEKIPASSEIFMDYIFTISIGWIVLEIIANVYLKQSTFRHALQKVYAWLVVYYANLIFIVFHLAYFAITVKPPHLSSYEGDMRNVKILLKLAYTIILIVEITIVHSHYIFEEKQKLNDIVQLKWKYVAQGKQLSKGVAYTSSSTFNEMTSRQTQEGSRVPPYITNINQN